MITGKQFTRSIILGALGAILLFVCFKVMLAIVWSKAYNDASDHFMGEISDRDAKIVSLEADFIKLSESAGKSWDDSRAEIAEVKRARDAELAKFKEKADSKMEEQQEMTEVIIQDNERLQLELINANDSIAYLVTFNYMSGIAWRIHEDNVLSLKDVELSDVYAKISICNERAAYLDNKLKLRPSREFRKMAIAAAAAFVFGKLL